MEQLLCALVTKDELSIKVLIEALNNSVFAPKVKEFKDALHEMEGILKGKNHAEDCLQCASKIPAVLLSSFSS